MEATQEVKTARIPAEPLKAFCRRVFAEMDVPPVDAEITADVLVRADLRGISSHGVARLRRYVQGLRSGMMRPRPDIVTLHETPNTALIDAGGGLGQPVSARAMCLAIEKARANTISFVAVRNSNHYGIAGYYAMMALEHDMIGLSMTNSAALVVPTFGRDAKLGTNPISLAAPAGEELPFVLDMATSTVPRGKLEVYDRLHKMMPLGWATDERGMPTEDPHRVLENLIKHLGGGLLPLSGAGELTSGYKGYGLALMVDILCGVLPGAGYADKIYPKKEDGTPLPANVGHFFGAMRVDGFRPVADFKATMDDIIRRLREAPKAEGEQRIYIHGEKEFEMEKDRRVNGVVLDAKVIADLKAIAEDMDIPYDL
jgi:L-2-hydroxycarboxylate dehydrogenase (NAD+)